MRRNVVSFTTVVLAVFACAVMLVANFSCKNNVGLGESIDTETPTLSIDYPPIGAIVKDSFVLSGSCSDDKGVAAVYVKVFDTATASQTKTPVDTLTATVDGRGTSWHIELNPYSEEDASFKYRDGTYQFSVEAVDGGGHVSGEFSRTLDIDNTPPVFIISKPGVVKESADRLKPSAYGSVFTIDGTIADDHAISIMDVKIYDKNGTIVSSETYTDGSLNEFFREEEIATAGGTSVTIAQAGSTRYETLYNNAVSKDSSGTALYYAEISLSDCAKKYKGADSSARAADSETADAETAEEGNSTSTVYLYDDVYTTLMSAKKGMGLSAADLKNILNGTYSSESVDADSVRQVLTDKAKNTAATENEWLSFTLNPDANPTYQVNGYAYSFEENATIQTASSGNALSVTVSAGLDGTNIAPGIVKVWLKEFDEKRTSEHEADIKNDIAKLVGQVAEKERTEVEFEENVTTVNDWLLIYDYSQNNETGSSVSTATFSVTLPAGKITLSKYYLVAVTGCDVDDVNFAQKEVYGFEGNEAGVPPTLTLISPENLSIVASSDATDLAFTGSAFLSSPSLYVAGLTATLSVSDETNGAAVGEKYVETISCSSAGGTWTNTAAFSFDETTKLWSFTPSALSGYETIRAAKESGVSYLYTLQIKGRSSSGHEATLTANVHIDTTPPVVNLISLTPTVEGSEYFGNGDTNVYLNGAVSVKGSFEDTNLETLRYDVWASTDLTKVLDESDSLIKAGTAANAKLCELFPQGNYDGSMQKAYSMTIPLPTNMVTMIFESLEGTSDPEIQFKVILYAEDKVGNIGSADTNSLNNGSSYIIKQATDRPKITSSNTNLTITTADGINTTDGNVFGLTTNNKVSVSFTDDDSVDTYKIYLYKEDGTLVDQTNLPSYLFGENPYTVYPKKSSVTYQYPLPATEGRYQMVIEAIDGKYVETSSGSYVYRDGTDASGLSGCSEEIMEMLNSYRKSVTGHFFLAVDSGSPSIEISAPVAGSYQSGIVAVSGTVSKADVAISGELLSIAADGTEHTAASGITIGSDIAPSSTVVNGSYVWTDSVTLPENASGSYKLKYTVTDSYGQNSDTKKSFIVDIDPPKFEITSPAGAVRTVYTADSMYAIKGTVTDGSATSGIAGVYYRLSEPESTTDPYGNTVYVLGEKPTDNGWSAAALATVELGSYTFTANVDLSGISSVDGTAASTVYFAVKDEAGNVSVVTKKAGSSYEEMADSASMCIYRDTTAPVTTLAGTGLKKPAASLTESEKTGSLDQAGNLILAAKTPLDETVTYYATDSTGGYSLSGVVTETSGTATVTVDGTEPTLSSEDGSWTFSGKTVDGTYLHEIVITDMAGNKVSKKVSVIRDTENPALTVSNITEDKA
ncbi:MAG: hypothetical protein K6G80_11630, partial [Treponema sp.]|nr:hypothetical protein [Treponema sp.]